jgi:hypothetical protein
VTLDGSYQNNVGGAAGTGTIVDTGLTTGTVYYYRLKAVNYDGESAYVNLGQVTPTAVTPPNLLSTIFNDGKGSATVQRSEIRNVVLTFDKAVALAAGSVTLSRMNTGGSGLNDGSAPTDVSSALGTPTTTDGGITWTIPILASVAGTSDATGSLVDNIYTVTVHAAGVTAGGTALTADTSTEFHRLFGDSNGNKSVDGTDFNRFRQAFGASGVFNAIFDFNGNASIDGTDFNNFRQRFGTKVFSY